MELTPQPDQGQEPERVNEGEFARGEVVDHRYKIIERIGRGGMGTVYKVEHLQIERVMALKVLLPELSGNRDFVARFKTEAMAVSRIGHQNIAEVTDFGQSKGHFYFVMQFVDGRTLRQALKADGAFPADRVRRIGLQLSRALAAAHAVGIVHRDIKPDNIMLTTQAGKEEQVKVLDFGIAKADSKNLVLVAPMASTAPSVMIGTPHYMAPEQVLGLPVDARTDVYSMGLLLHEMLTGARTFQASVPEIFRLQVEAAPPSLDPSVPVGLSNLVSQMLAKPPSARPVSMSAVSRQLESVITSRGLRALSSAPTLLVKNTVQAVTEKLEAVKVITARVRRVVVPSQPAAPQAPAPIRLLAAAPAQPVAKLRSAAQLASPSASATNEPLFLPTRPLAPWVAAAITTVVLTCLGVWALRDQPTSHPVGETAAGSAVAPAPWPVPPTAPPVRLNVKLTLDTVPKGAEVYDHDVLLGVTPVVLRREAEVVSELTLVLKNFEPITRKVLLQGDTTLTIELTPKAKPAAAPAAAAPAIASPPASSPDPKQLKDIDW